MKERVRPAEYGFERGVFKGPRGILHTEKDLILFGIQDR